MCVYTITPDCLRLGIAGEIIKWHPMTKTDAASHAAFFKLNCHWGCFTVNLFLILVTMSLNNGGTTLKGIFFIADTLEYSIHAWVYFHEGIVKHLWRKFAQ